MDYLLKPIDKKKTGRNNKKLNIPDYKEEKSADNIDKDILTENSLVFVKDGDRCWFIKLSEIRLFESVGNYAKVHFGNNKPLILKSLNALEERLDPKVFLEPTARIL